ncbi:hypothetical protein [Dysgonomonas sp. 25]|uniref:hypothetical protein n=1 Tax=Dysgonomonas sp. 25 TaxID=2302933 RepID=UPI0013D69DA3|nr:hypothetical protein [Dysgonomonas sp. 25]NDV67348.1 hypothetical protein [Dysgonomonas sp. 25]
MLIKGFLLTAFLIALLIMMLVSLILAIVKRKNKSSRNKCLLAAGAMFVFSLLTAGYILYKTVYTIKNIENDDVVEFFSDALSSTHSMNSLQMRKLVNMQPQGVTISGEYYTYAGFRDYYRMPLIYPYSLTAIDDLEEAVIEDETGVKVLIDSNKSKQLLHGITAFSFNRDALYATVCSHFDTDTTYAVIHFHPYKIEKFTVKEDALRAAEEAGLDKEQQTVKDYYYAFSRFD